MALLHGEPPESSIVSDSHQHGADVVSIVLPGSLLNPGIDEFADRAQGLLLTHGNFFQAEN
jgi:hypothetical protein